MSSKIFSLKEELYFRNYQPKIEIINCPTDHQQCVAQLPFINQCFYESQQAFLSKDYERAIEQLKLAFDSTFEASQPCCSHCQHLFRSTIIDSLETIETDLKKMTSGWLKASQHKGNFQLATKTLEECKGRM